MDYQYNPRSRYRARSRQQTNRFLVVMLVVVCVFFMGIVIGRSLVQASKSADAQQLTVLKDQVSDLQGQLATQMAEAQTAQLRFEQLQKLFNEQFPEDGPLRELTMILKTQLEAGQDPDRLSFLIKSSRPPSNCTDPQNKRFVVVTPAYSGAETALTIDEGALIISATGESAMGGQGNLEAWFDPAKPVKITFQPRDGQVVEKQGRLPLQHTLVVGAREYRVTLSAGEQSFIKVTFDSCDYP